MSLLVVENLETHFISRDLDNRVRVARALNRVNFSVDRGEAFYKVQGIIAYTCPLTSFKNRPYIDTYFHFSSLPSIMSLGIFHPLANSSDSIALFPSIWTS